MKNLYIRKGDTVQVMKGKDRGKRGKVLKVQPEERRVVVEGVNRAKKHMRPSKANPQGGIIDWELPVDISNVMLVCGGCDSATRVGRKHVSEGAMVRICKRCEREI